MTFLQFGRSNAARELYLQEVLYIFSPFSLVSGRMIAHPRAFVKPPHGGEMARAALQRRVCAPSEDKSTYFRLFWALVLTSDAAEYKMEMEYDRLQRTGRF